jgi:hypothetical protein
MEMITKSMVVFVICESNLNNYKNDVFCLESSRKIIKNPFQVIN